MLNWLPPGTHDGPALIDNDTTITWNALRDRVDALARELKRAGVGKRQRVWVDVDDTREQITRFLALNSIGAVAVLPHRRWPQCVQQARVAEVEASFRWTAAGFQRLGATSTNARDAIDAIDAIDILFTSGSSGPPKAFAHDEEGHRQSATAVTAALGFSASDAWALDLPLSHVGGLCVVMRACLTGGAIVLPGTSGLAMDNPRANFVSVVPTHLHRVLDDAKRTQAWSNKSAVLVGGAAVSPTLAARVRSSAFGEIVSTSYGMTELTSTIAVADAGDIGGPLRSLPHVRVRIEAGRIAVRSPSVARAVSSETAHRLDDEGYFKTGDQGRWAADGRFEVTGRDGRMFISGGENVTPEHVEAILIGGGARAAAVVALPSEQWGSIGVAFVAGVDDTDAFLAKISPQLSPFERPKHVFSWPADMSESKPEWGPLRVIAQQAISIDESAGGSLSES